MKNGGTVKGLGNTEIKEDTAIFVLQSPDTMRVVSSS